MSLLRQARLIYSEKGILELFKRCHSFVRERGMGWVGGQLIAESSLSVKFKYLISYSGFLTAIYFYFRRTFKHEQRAILRGHYKYYKREREQESPEHRIIRHTHMLEKGISMKDRREVFAEGIVDELISNVMTAWDKRNNPESDDQLKWSIDVLHKYFTVVNIESKTLSDAHQKFQTFIKSNNIEVGDRIPHQRIELETNPVKFEDLQALAEQRSSTRWFRHKSVPHEKLDKAFRIALQSPSACNRQSFEYKVFDRPETLQQILQPPLGVTGYRDNIPCLVVLIGRHQGYFKESEKNVPYIDASLSAMAFQFALETIGLASCTINWPAIYSEHKRINEIINLDEDEFVITLMAVGYPDPNGKIPYSNKKSIDKIRSYNDV